MIYELNGELDQQVVRLSIQVAIFIVDYIRPRLTVVTRQSPQIKCDITHSSHFSLFDKRLLLQSLSWQIRSMTFGKCILLGCVVVERPYFAGELSLSYA